MKRTWLHIFVITFSFILLTGFKIEDNSTQSFGAGDLSQKANKLFGDGRSRKPKRMNLSECIDRSLNSYLDLSISDEAIEGAKEKINEASRIGHPVWDYEYNLAPAPKNVDEAMPSFFRGDITVFNRGKVGVGIPLNTFGKVKTGKELAQKGVEAELNKKEQKKGEVTLKVKQLFYGIQFASEMGRLLRSAYSNLDKEIKKKIDEGGVDPSQVAKMKLFRSELEKKIDEVDKKALLAMEALRVQMNMSPEENFVVSPDRLSAVKIKYRRFEDILEEAYQNRPDLKLLETGIQAKEKQVTLEKRLMTPNLGVGGFFEFGNAPGVTGVDTTDDFNDPFNYTRAGIGFQLKGTLDIHTSMAKVRQNKSDLRKIYLQKELAQSGIALEVKEAYLDIKNAGKDMARCEENQKVSRQIVFLNQSNLDLGLGDSKELIEGLTTYLQAKAQYFESIFNYNMAAAKLENKIGRLSAESQL